MIIRVSYGDNDFQSDIEKACYNFMVDVSQGFDGVEASDLFKTYLNENGIDDLRQRIVLGAVGFYIAKEAVWGRFVDGGRQGYNDTLSTFDTILKYIDEIVKCVVVKKYQSADDNGEVCYIDFFKNKVFVC